MKKFEIKNRGNKTAEVYIYEEIGDNWFGGISARAFIDELNKLGTMNRIDVRIFSDGGSVFDGMAIYNALVRNPATIVTHADSLAASIASVIFMAGEERHIAENATLMIHDPWTVTAGGSDELRKSADLLDQIRGQIMQSYLNRINIDQDTLDQMMAAETWMLSDQALEMGFATHVSEEMKVAAMAYDLKKFKHPPEYLTKMETENNPNPVACDKIRKMRAGIAALTMAASGRNPKS